MAKRYLFARLGGADRKVLAEEETGTLTGERTRATAMGGVLLATASVATVSMFFALHHAVGVPLGWAVPFALAWGVVIINTDRILIITMNGTRGHPVRMAVTMFSRLVLAALIAFIVATPLVLVIFASDIGAALPTVQQQQSKLFAQSLVKGAEGKQLTSLGSQISNERTTVTNDQNTVNTLTGNLATARNTASTEYRKWQCEKGGLKGLLCPPRTSGKFGNGPLALGDKNQWKTDEQNANNIAGQLTTARNSRTSAQNTLTGLKTARAGVQNKITTLINNDDKANQHDTGLLNQIQALDEASAKDVGLAIAHWTVTALFFVIEILPVSVKCLLLLGPPTAYEEILEAKGKAAVQQAELTTQAEMQVAKIKADSIIEIAEVEARHRRSVRDTELESQYAITVDREQARQAVETDWVRREKGTRIEVNRKFASATREHILAAVDAWGHRIREKINHGMRERSANGKVPPPAQEERTPGYDSPNLGGLL